MRYSYIFILFIMNISKKTCIKYRRRGGQKLFIQKKSMKLLLLLNWFSDFDWFDRCKTKCKSKKDSINENIAYCGQERFFLFVMQIAQRKSPSFSFWLIWYFDRFDKHKQNVNQWKYCTLWTRRNFLFVMQIAKT